MIYHRIFFRRLTQQVLLLEQKVLTIPEHMSSPTGFVGLVLLNLEFSV